MKNNVLSCAMLVCICLFTIPCNAQLTVSQSGDVNMAKHVAINGAIPNDTSALLINVPEYQGHQNFGVYSYSIGNIQPIAEMKCRIGVFGQIKTEPFLSLLDGDNTRPLPAKFNAGIAGLSNTCVGVYGGTGTSLPYTWDDGIYAGYFDGNTKVIGVLTTSLFTISSNNQSRENISEIDNGFSRNKLSLFRPISYTLQRDSNHGQSTETDVIKHYGLVAEEVQQILPELVYEDGAGNLSINYIELIPLLIKEIQELSAEVTELKKIISTLTQEH